eukprot:CFRG3928T1
MLAFRGAAVMRPMINSSALRAGFFGRARQMSTKSDEFFSKQARLARPMSPHLTIYSPQLTSMLSITHRASGVAWTVAMCTFGIGTMVAQMPFEDIIKEVKAMNIPTGCVYAAKFILTWPFAYHTVNGVRHLVWDRAMALSLPAVYNTGYVSVAVSTALAGLITVQ